MESIKNNVEVLRGYFDVIWQNSRFLPWGGLNEAYLRYL